MPAIFYQGGEDPSFGTAGLESPQGVDFGDVRIGLRAQLFRQRKGHIALGIGGYVWIPTGSGSFSSDGVVRGLPMLTASGKVSRFVYSFSTGVDLGANQEVGKTELGDRYQASVAAGLVFGPEDMFQVGPELSLGLTLRDVAKTTTNAEALLGGKARVHRFWVLGLGAGGGLAGGVGTPDFRALASIAFSPKEDADRDGDGVFDRLDACPMVAGIRHDDPKKNGCPPDRDRDGIIDERDACPDDAGPPSDDSKEHGCPDSDEDTIVDVFDACPRVPGPANDDPSKNGCPKTDKDGDGVLDDMDACIDEPGVATDDPKTNGCPPDRDGDGVLDAKDACPDEAGVASDDPQNNGCPDRDGDKILDAEDACPDKWGSANEDPAKHGCPAVEVSTDKIVILQKIHFAVGSAEILQDSFALIDEIAHVLSSNPNIEEVEIQGHTDNRGGRALNQKLSQERASSVREALVARGVAPERLTSKGYGLDEPIATNATAEGREKNRRVEFKILKMKDETMGTDTEEATR